uniref:Epimerase domain-containing protein n=1 Tax=Gongylonema pulchrum TaxID=637853 RepID=A0A183DW76_9BILA
LESKRMENYGRSKPIAEKAAWNYWNTLPEASRFQLTVLNPTFVTGPVLSDQDHGSATFYCYGALKRFHLTREKAIDVRLVAPKHTSVHGYTVFMLVTLNRLFLYRGKYSSLLERSKVSRCEYESLS